MSDFVYLFRIGVEAQREAMGTPERAQQVMERWMVWMRKLEANGHLKDRGQPLDRGGKVVRGKQQTVTDGPYVEAKDLVAGFIVVEARDLAQAVELSAAARCSRGAARWKCRPSHEADVLIAWS